MSDITTLKLQLSARKKLTADISEFVFTHTEQAMLPVFSPGAHVTVKTPSGAMRRYSLVNDGTAPHEYVVAIKKEASSRGGSQSMHESLSIGDDITVQAPENSFPMHDGPQYLLIAGGIGVTPIYAMAKHLVEQGADVQMIYCTRSAEETAYRSELEALLGDRLVLHHDEGQLDQLYDFWYHFEKPGKGLVYCCGPAPLMEEIKSVSGHWREGSVQFEDFKAIDAVRTDDKPFEVLLKSTGESYQVAADKTILEALRESGIATVSSCESGTCGTCKCGLISGDVDHRDRVLMEDEMTNHIILCVSRAREGTLTLDL